jgi:iron complex transport system permease protein
VTSWKVAADRIRHGTIRVPLGWTSVQVRPVLVLVLGLAVLAMLALLVAHLVVGGYGMPASEAIDALFGGGDQDTQFVVSNLRLPRPLVALAAGAAFGASGALLQRISGNQLASPDLLGVLGGANLAVVVLSFGFPSAGRTWVLPVALLGGFAAAGVVALTAGRHASPLTALMIGTAITVIANAVTTAVVASGQVVQAYAIVLWLVGGLYSRSWYEFNVAINALFVLLPLSLLLARRIDHLDMGRELAVGLGVPVRSTRTAALILAGAMAAVGVAVSGPLAFVGLVAPHMARRLVGDATSGLLLVSAAMGALVVCFADLLARSIWSDELPTGVIVPALGIPLLLVLLRRRTA